jgi:hypothetical protein
MCAWKEKELKLLAPMASNKNECEFNKKVEIMTNDINAQLPKKIIGSMVFVEMRPILPLEMGNVTSQCTKRAFEHSKQREPKSLSKPA